MKLFKTQIQVAYDVVRQLETRSRFHVAIEIGMGITGILYAIATMRQDENICVECNKCIEQMCKHVLSDRKNVRVNSLKDADILITMKSGGLDIKRL